MDGVYRSRSEGKSVKGIQAAVFDFDGTISTLRCGWEAVMRRMMLSVLPPDSDMESRVDRYIDESAGVQTIYQMEWLARTVAETTGGPEPDPWDYKDRYNALLMEGVERRKQALARGEAKAEAYLIPGSVPFLKDLRNRGIAIYIAS